jgi:dGTPase
LSSVSMKIEQFTKMQLLKTICYDLIIDSPRMKMAERPGISIIKKIFKTLSNEREGRRLLPHDWADVYFGFSTEEMRKRTICDFIANMTDRYCVEFYSRIVGLNPPSIHKPY